MPLTEGKMRVYGFLTDSIPNLWNVPNLFLQKFHSPGFSATAKVKVTARDDRQQSGIVVMGRDYFRVAVQKQGDKFIIRCIECHDAENSGQETIVRELPLTDAKAIEAGLYPNYECDIWLRLDVAPTGFADSHIVLTERNSMTPVCHSRHAKGNGSVQNTASTASLRHLPNADGSMWIHSS